MAKFAATYPDKEFVQQAVAQIPWGHNVVILDKVVCVYRTEEDNSITIETENTIYHLEKCYS